MQKIFLAMIAALFVLVAGCTGAQQQGGQASNGTPSGGTPSGGAPSGGTPSGGGSGVDLTTCVADCGAAGSGDVADLCRAGCYMDAAESSLDASKCDPINQMENMSTFYATCLGNVAGKKQDISPCRKLTDSGDKDFCINIAADEYKNPAICDEINNSIYRSVCLDDTAGN